MDRETLAEARKIADSMHLEARAAWREEDEQAKSAAGLIIEELANFAERHIEAPPCQHHHDDGTQCMKPSVPGSLNCPEHDHDEPDLVETVARAVMSSGAFRDDKIYPYEMARDILSALQGRILGEGEVAVPVEVIACINTADQCENDNEVRGWLDAAVEALNA